MCMQSSDWGSLDGSWHSQPIKHVLESQQFGMDAIEVIFRTANAMESVKPGEKPWKDLHMLGSDKLLIQHYFTPWRQVPCSECDGHSCVLLRPCALETHHVQQSQDRTTWLHDECLLQAPQRRSS